MQILFDEEQRPDDEMQAIFQRAADIALERETLDPVGYQVSFFFAAPEEIRSLNLQYRNIDSATDVLSFPMYDSPDEICAAAASPTGVPALLGDIVICREIAVLQAEEYGHSVERELLYLFVHSLFHLLGYDHEGVNEVEKRAMRAAEEDVLDRVGVIE
jgi:probable rRNA maturation factor